MPVVSPNSLNDGYLQAYILCNLLKEQRIITDVGFAPNFRFAVLLLLFSLTPKRWNTSHINKMCNLLQ